MFGAIKKLNWPIRILAEKFGFNRAVGLTYANLFVLSVQGIVTTYFILFYLTLRQQGIWYTFISLSALMILAELGFTGMISQAVSHIYAKLEYRGGVMRGDSGDLDKLFSLIGYAVKIFSGIAIASVFVMAVIGHFFFSQESLGIMLAFLAFAFVLGINLMAMLLQAIYQGLDKVAEVQGNILISNLLSLAALWLLLFFGFNVWSLVISRGLAAVSLLLFVFLQTSKLWRQYWRHQRARQFNWFREIFPVQGKYALSSLSSYLIFNLYIPVAYKYSGPVVAGKIGLTLMLVQAVVTISIAWANSKVPTFNILVAMNKRQELSSLLKKSVKLSCLLYLLGSLLLFGLIAGFKFFNFFGDRFAGVNIMALIMLSQFQTVVFAPLIIYLRAHKDDPWFPVAMTYGGLTALAIFVVLPLYGLVWLMIAVNIINWGVAAPFGWRLFNHYRRQHERESLKRIRDEMLYENNVNNAAIWPV